MRRAPSKKSIERRKNPRKSAARGSKSASPSASPSVSLQNSLPHASTEKVQSTEELCQNCAKDLKGSLRALFVEEEIGRIFCTESCIASYFTPEIERLEKGFFKRLSPSDLSSDEREQFAHLRWITLQEPDEVWREKTIAGDYRYTLISEFEPSQKKVWCICICLFLRGEPSFLYLAFTTLNAAMSNYYRKGEQLIGMFSRKRRLKRRQFKRKPKPRAKNPLHLTTNRQLIV